MTLVTVSTEQTKPNSKVNAQVSNRKSSHVVRLEREKIPSSHKGTED